MPSRSMRSSPARNLCSKYLLSHVKEIRKLFRGELLEGQSVLLEWSLAQHCDIHKTPLGEAYLIFYEVRTL